MKQNSMRFKTWPHLLIESKNEITLNIKEDEKHGNKL